MKEPNCPGKQEELSFQTELCSLTNEWITTDEAAAYLKISVGALRNFTSNGKIPYYKFGRRNRYRIGDLRELLSKNKRGGSDGP